MFQHENKPTGKRLESIRKANKKRVNHLKIYKNIKEWNNSDDEWLNKELESG